MAPLSLLLSAVLLITVFGCGIVEPPPVDGFMALVDDATGLDDLDEEIAFADPAQWVESYRPDAAASGYNLVFYRRRVPMLIDMQGRVVHTWPNVRGVGRARLGRDGRLLVIGVEDSIKEYDWDGRLTWAYALPRDEDLPHHDVINLAGGNILVLAQETATRSDYIQEIDRDGRVVWEWWPRDHLDEHFPDRDRRYPDPTHLNSLDELGENRWFDGGDERFRPGNILVSARNLNAVFVIDKRSGKISWKHFDGLDFQHEAQMVAAGVLGEGLVVVFNNGYHNLNAYRRSEIRAIDPTNGRVVWSFSDPTFYTTVAGTQQVLANGNVLVTSSEGGRVFEVTPEKEKVWEWIPPYLPMRVTRYSADHCPQLEALGPMDQTAVTHTDRQRWVDVELGQFSFREDYRVETLYGLVREVLKRPEGCRELLLPPQPVIQAAYGYDDSKLDGAPDEARFIITVRELDREKVRTVIDETLTRDGEEIFIDRYAAVPGLGLRRVELCLAVEVQGEEVLHPSVFMTNPRFYSQPRAQQRRQWKDRRLSLQEQSLQERQLRAIGYVE